MGWCIMCGGTVQYLQPHLITMGRLSLSSTPRLNLITAWSSISIGPQLAIDLVVNLIDVGIADLIDIGIVDLIDTGIVDSHRRRHVDPYGRRHRWTKSKRRSLSIVIVMVGYLISLHFYYIIENLVKFRLRVFGPL
jgi:hypothetical protein